MNGLDQDYGEVKLLNKINNVCLIKKNHRLV